MKAVFLTGSGRTNNYIYLFDLITHLVKRNFLLKYKGSFLGILWSIVPPMAQLLVLVFVFGKILPLGIKGYPAFVFTSILPWTWFSTSVSSAGSLFIGNRDLLKSPHFAPWTLIIVESLLNLLTYLFLLPVLMLALFIYQREPSWYLLVFPLLLFIQGVLIVGLGLFIATMNVFYRDIHHIVALAVTLLFYITPVFYRTNSIPPKLKILYDVNPVAALIQGYKDVFFYGRAPDWGALGLAALMSTLVCLAGYTIYKRKYHSIFDLI